MCSKVELVERNNIMYVLDTQTQMHCEGLLGTSGRTLCRSLTPDPEGGWGH